MADTQPAHRPHPWSDGYVAVVADQLLWTLEGHFARLQRVDPEASAEELRNLLTRVRRAGHTIDEQTPALLPESDGLAHVFDALYETVQRVRAAGAHALTDPGDLALALPCLIDFPREYRGLPPATLAPPAEVELIHMGDLPPRVADWQRRAELTRYPNLRGLSLFNAGLGNDLGVELGALPRLLMLDLRDNGMSELPAAVLDCAALEHLDLAGNPLRALPDLSPLASLRYLRLSRTRLSTPQVQEARLSLRGCHIDT